MSIDLSGVALERSERLVLRDITLTIEERRVGIIGANGSGKSSFARLLNGLVLPSEGKVTVDGLDTRRDTKAVRRKVGFVFQNPDNQIVYPTVGEDIVFGLKNRGYSKAEIAAKVEAILSRLELSALKDRLAHELSGGERQMVALAGVLVLKPDWLVLDEPTTLLDLRNAKRIMSHIERLDQRAIMITHDLKRLEDFDRVLVIDEGRILCDDRPAAAIAAYERLVG
ncbi:biotin transport system ATP-binding protein [Fulvimarina manganoxydans]|uniref:Biotin transport system ATP-binding protein n=1 Tax=Fulvimarina manganoxydans TaxID=937218 RepID=A0A1W2E003_9HYPH|nr:ABC transporter ATP-binding protein [Fulvimarina manganoxydans]SMD03039.1 biotin transport system ATP-binding protein [Fulvimarina manganoxydans]